MRGLLLSVRAVGAACAAPFRIVHAEGQVHPLNGWLAASFWRRFLALACLLLALEIMVRFGVTDLLAWTERVFPTSRYRWLFAGFLATYLGVHVLDDRYRRSVLMVSSLAAMISFSWRFAFGSLVFFLAYYVIVFASVHRWVKLGFLLAVFAGLIVVSNLLWFPELLTRHPWILLLTYTFAVSYTFRIFYFYHEARLRKFQRVPFGDFLLYFIFAPYFVIVPYMFAIPRYSTFAKGLQARDSKVEAGGVRYLMAGAALALAFFALARVYDPRTEFIAHLRAEAWLHAVAIGVLYYPITIVLSALGVAYILVGMLQVMGIDVSPAFHRPLTSTSIHDWWRRWNIHFRDFLVDIFFYPLMIRWRRRNPYLTIVVGCVSVFIVGSTFFHWIAKYYFAVNSHANVYWSIVVENSLMCVAVAVGLCLEKRRILRRPARSPTKPPQLEDPGTPVGVWFRHRLARWGQRAATYLLLLSIVVFAGYGATFAAYYQRHDRIKPRLVEAMALADAGRPDDAAAVIAADLPHLQALARMRPRDAALRLELAWMHTLPLPSANRTAQEAHWVTGRTFANPSDPWVQQLILRLRPFQER